MLYTNGWGGTYDLTSVYSWFLFLMASASSVSWETHVPVISSNQMISDSVRVMSTILSRSASDTFSWTSSCFRWMSMKECENKGSTLFWCQKRKRNHRRKMSAKLFLATFQRTYIHNHMHTMNLSYTVNYLPTFICCLVCHLAGHKLKIQAHLNCLQNLI